MNKFLMFLIALAVVVTAIAPLDIGVYTQICIEPVTGSAVLAAGASFLNNFLGGLFGSSDADANREWNWKAMMQQYYNQQNLNKGQNDFQRYMLGRMQDYQSKEWDKQFSMNANYNSVVNQAARLRNAGFNPSALIGGTSSLGSVVGSPSSPSSPSPSVPSGGSASLAAPAITDSAVLSQRGSYIKDLASSVSTIARLPLEMKEKEASTGLIYSQIANTISDENLKKAMTTAQNIENICNSKYMEKEAAAKIRLINNESVLAYLKGDNVSADTALKKVQRALEDENVKSAITKNTFLAGELAATVELLKQQSMTEKAKQTELSTRSALNLSEKALTDIKSDIQSIELDVSREAKTQRVETLIKKYEAQFLQGEASSEEAKLLRDRIYDMRNARNKSDKDRYADMVLYYLSRELGLSNPVHVNISE